jgi:hypothetical protein
MLGFAGVTGDFLMQTTAAIEPDGKCRFCGKFHGVQCPDVRAIEYYENGSIKRVEYKTAQDFAQPWNIGNWPVGDWPLGPTIT